jgi:transcriptional antiterminator NusG
VEVAAEAPVARNLFTPGQMVRVIDGPFNDFNGVVESFDANRSKVKVSVLVFGRATQVEFEANQIEAA